jgi:PAS domain S-box-containing protein
LTGQTEQSALSVYENYFLNSTDEIGVLTQKYKSALKAIVENARKYQQLVENIPDIIYRTDKEGKITFISPYIKDITGYGVPEAMGLNITKDMYDSPEQRKVLLETLEESGSVHGFGAQLKRKDGSFWWGAAIFDCCGMKPEKCSGGRCWRKTGQSLSNPGFLNFILEQLEAYHILVSKICFEITETVAISNLTEATKFNSILKAEGCHFALDDFGSGLSSFGYLKNLPVDFLKIDGMFVKDMVNDPIDHAMVKSINDIGQVMQMKTIGEFVENSEIKTMLKDLGVNCAQGYAVGKPEPLENILKQENK